MQKSKLLKCAINRTNIDKIDDIAKSVGIEWFCTPMNPAAVELIDPYVTKFKIRELDGRILLENKTNDIIDKILNILLTILIKMRIVFLKHLFYLLDQISLKMKLIVI